jgi:beta-glucosidase
VVAPPGKAPLKEVAAALTPDEKMKPVVGMSICPAGFPEGLLPARMPGRR